MGKKFKAPNPAEIATAMASPIPKPNSKVAAFEQGDMSVCQYYDPGLTAIATSPDAINVAPPMPKPRASRDDWLIDHEEAGQPFRGFLRAQFKAVPHASFNTIALVILAHKGGSGPGLSKKVQEALKAYVAAFYQLHVEIVGPVDVTSAIEQKVIGSCTNAQTGDLQIFCKDTMEFASSLVRKDKTLSRKAVCTMALTMIDLTPDDSWNFVYGQASLTDAHGVFSLARFAPRFNGEACDSQEEEEGIILRRGCKVLTHELGHIFGLKHCIYFRCLMNGCNHVGELQQQREIECPACTKKLLHSFAWDLEQRYQDVAKAAAAIGLTDVSDMVTNHVLPCLSAGVAAGGGAKPTSIKTKYTM